MASMRAVIYITIGGLLGSACFIVQGPLPGDVLVTRALQSIFGTPSWAMFLSDTAKLPVLWGTLIVAILLAFVHGGWRHTATPVLALILAEILDALLRALVFAPRPSADVVAVASPSASSGFPSTFGLVYGALFGAAIRMTSNRNIATATASTIALFLIAAGVIARVVLGGHWFSQIMASTFIGLALAAAVQIIMETWTAGYRGRLRK
jgi:membrane-associated phospholipid phosphatase